MSAASARGTQSPLQTLASGRGSCRDFATLMMEAARALGLAARFVSGYLYVPERDTGEMYQGGGATHAWCQVYLPGSGWVEFDPTNGIVGNRDLIRVAVARDARQAIPLHGFYYGDRAHEEGMVVSVRVRSLGDNTELGSRQMLIEAGYDIAFQCPAQTPMLLQLNIHPTRVGDLRSPDVIYSDPPYAMRAYLDHYGNRVTRVEVPAGLVTFHNRFRDSRFRPARRNPPRCRADADRPASRRSAAVPGFEPLLRQRQSR